MDKLDNSFTKQNNNGIEEWISYNISSDITHNFIFLSFYGTIYEKRIFNIELYLLLIIDRGRIDMTSNKICSLCKSELL